MDDRQLNYLQQCIERLEKVAEAIHINSLHGRENAHATLLGLLAAADGRYADPKSLSRHVSQVYSQHMEDGFIAEIFNRIGPGSRTFLEIGIEDGRQNTTRLLLEQGWTGYWVEGYGEYAERAKATFAPYVERGALTVIHSIVTAENINGILDAAGVPAELDLISLDIDYNTSHVWRALDRKARACCIEYNASLPPSADLEVPYDPNRFWDGSNWFGASLKALENIGRSKGMHLVGCDPVGVNGYFVAAGEAEGKFLEPFTAEHHYESPKYHLTNHRGHPPSPEARMWVSGAG